MKFRVGDNVIVTTGADKGKTGVVGKVFAHKNQVWVDGVNQKTRHIKGQQGQPGDKVQFFAPIEASNVAVVDPKTGKATRIGFGEEKGQKVRIAKSSGAVLPNNKGKVPAPKVAKKDEKADSKKTKTIKA